MYLTLKNLGKEHASQLMQNCSKTPGLAHCEGRGVELEFLGQLSQASQLMN